MAQAFGMRFHLAFILGVCLLAGCGSSAPLASKLGSGGADSTGGAMPAGVGGSGASVSSQPVGSGGSVSSQPLGSGGEVGSSLSGSGSRAGSGGTNAIRSGGVGGSVDTDAAFVSEIPDASVFGSGGTVGSVDVAFAPESLSDVPADFKPASLEVATSPLDMAPDMVTIPPRPAFTFAPAEIDLGTVQVGVPAPKQRITITAFSAITDLSISFLNPAVSMDASTTCTRVLAAGAFCTVVVNFTATHGGPDTGFVIISTGGYGPYLVPIYAVVPNSAKLVISPSMAAFASEVGMTGSAITFDVANAGDVVTGALVVAVTGPNAADFKITQNDCMLLAPLAACTVAVVFSPKSVGATGEVASLTVSDIGPGTASVSASLTGTVYSAAALTITSPTSDLGVVLVGSAGTVTTFTVSNSGDAATGALSVSISGPEFVMVTDTCTGVSLAKTWACTVGIELKPATVGAKSAVLTVNGTSGVPAVKVISGVGVVI